MKRAPLAVTGFACILAIAAMATVDWQVCISYMKSPGEYGVLGRGNNGGYICYSAGLAAFEMGGTAKDLIVAGHIALVSGIVGCLGGLVVYLSDFHGHPLTLTASAFTSFAFFLSSSLFYVLFPGEDQGSFFPDLSWIGMVAAFALAATATIMFARARSPERAQQRPGENLAENE